MRPNMALQTIQVQDQEFQVDVYEIGKRFQELQAFISKTFKAEPKQSKDCIIVPAKEWESYARHQGHYAISGFAQLESGIIHIPTNASFSTIVHEMLHLYDYIPSDYSSKIWREGIVVFATSIILRKRSQWHLLPQFTSPTYHTYGSIIQLLQLWSGMNPVSFVSAYFNRTREVWIDLYELIKYRVFDSRIRKTYGLKNNDQRCQFTDIVQELVMMDGYNDEEDALSILSPMPSTIKHYYSILVLWEEAYYATGKTKWLGYIDPYTPIKKLKQKYDTIHRNFQATLEGEKC